MRAGKLVLVLVHCCNAHSDDGAFGHRVRADSGVVHCSPLHDGNRGLHAQAFEDGSVNILVFQELVEVIRTRKLLGKGTNFAAETFLDFWVAN